MSQERRCDQRHVQGIRSSYIQQKATKIRRTNLNTQRQSRFGDCQCVAKQICGSIPSVLFIKQSVQHTRVSSDETFEARCRGRLTRGYKTKLKGPTVSFQQALQMETTVLAWEHSLKEFPAVGSQRTLHLPQLLSSPLQVVLRSLCVSSTLESSRRHGGEMGCHTGPVGTHPWTPWPIPPRTQLCSLSSHIIFFGP